MQRFAPLRKMTEAPAHRNVTNAEVTKSLVVSGTGTVWTLQRQSGGIAYSGPMASSSGAGISRGSPAIFV